MIDIYWVRLPAPEAVGNLEAALAILDRSERQTYDTYRVAFKRVEFLTGRILAKSLLAARLETAPGQIRFALNEHGKPFLHPTQGRSDLYFNLSHTDGLVACVISPFVCTGIDVERKSRAAFDVMPLVFDDDEIRFVDAQITIAERLHAFYLLWTRKEAVMKAVGKGFALPPKSFTVPLDREGARTALYVYHTFELGSDHLVSLVYAEGRIVGRDQAGAIPVLVKVTELSIQNLLQLSLPHANQM